MEISFTAQEDEWTRSKSSVVKFSRTYWINTLHLVSCNCLGWIRTVWLMDLFKYAKLTKTKTKKLLYSGIIDLLQ